MRRGAVVLLMTRLGGTACDASSVEDPPLAFEAGFEATSEPRGSQALASAAAGEPGRPLPSDRPVIATVRWREGAVVLTGSGTGLRFSVRSPSGALLAAALTEAEFAERFSVLYGRYRESLAGSDVFLDARGRPRETAPWQLEPGSH